MNVGNFERCDQGGCCGPYSGFPVTLAWSPADDDHGAALVRYNVYSHSNDAGPSGAIVARFVDAQQLQGGIICLPPPFTSGVINGGLGTALKGTYSVRAVDAAGNEDQNAATVEIAKMCPEPDDGASLDATIDQASGPRGGADAGPNPSGTPDSSGCSIARSRDVSAGSLFAFIGLLLATAARFSARTKGRRHLA